MIVSKMCDLFACYLNRYWLVPIRSEVEIEERIEGSHPHTDAHPLSHTGTEKDEVPQEIILTLRSVHVCFV